MQPVRGDEKFASSKKDFHAHLRALGLAQAPVGQSRSHLGEEVVLVVGLEDEAVGTGLQPSHHISGIDQGGQEDHRKACEFFCLLDLAAELVAIHLGHDDIADNQGGQALADGGEGFPAIARGGKAIAMLFEDVLQLLGLRGAVLDNEDFHVLGC